MIGIATKPDATEQDVLDHVAINMEMADISNYEVNVDMGFSDDTGEPVSVEVTTLYEEVTWLPLPNYLANKTLEGMCVLPHE